jgi:hypothetical protein
MEDINDTEELAKLARLDQLDTRIAETTPKVAAILRAEISNIHRLANSHPHSWSEIDCRTASTILKAVQALILADLL